MQLSLLVQEQYLLDANVVIQAHKKYYPMEIDPIRPLFWNWLLSHAQDGRFKIPAETMDEIEPGNKESELFKWIQSNKTTLKLDEDIGVDLVDRVIREGYELSTAELTDEIVSKINRDALLISYALARPKRLIVTLEAVQREAKPQNRKIPLVCKRLGIPCINTFQLIRIPDLAFGTRK